MRGRISQFAWCVLSPADFQAFWAVEMESEYRDALNPGRDWVVYVEARDQRGRAVLSSTGAVQGVLADGFADDAAGCFALSVAAELAERLLADGHVIPPDPETCVVRVPVPREYRSEAA
jgi:hypothetical protein